MDDCLINNQDADRIIVTIRKLAKSFKIDAYNEYTGRGTIRHVLVRRGFYSRQILVAIVCASPIFPHKAKFIEELIKIHPEITTVVMDVNKNGLNLTLGGNETVLYGNGYIEDTLCGYAFKVTAGSFYQVNTQQTEVLYDCAIKMAGLTGREKVLDAYCGVGTIGIISSEFAKEVKAVELNGEAVKNAIDNARINDINNISFYRGDAGKFMVDMSAKGEKFDVVFMDPPRAGSSREFLSALVRTCPKKIIYISCNPQTQKRDIEFLVRNKYRVKKIQPVDMFPHTSHVECVAELRLAKSAQI